MSNDPAEFITNISDMPVEQQIDVAMYHTRNLRGEQVISFLKHPAVVAWIRANTKAINERTRIALSKP